jgi:hypothetical protein
VCYIRSNKGKMCNKVYFLWCSVEVDAVIFLPNYGARHARGSR